MERAWSARRASAALVAQTGFGQRVKKKKQLGGILRVDLVESFIEADDLLVVREGFGVTAETDQGLGASREC